MNREPFSSTEAFRDAFAAGLHGLLRNEEGLGPFVLVLANATFDPAIRRRLGDDLPRRFAALADGCRCALVAGRRIPGPEDDLNVFLKLATIGYDQLDQACMRQLGSWEIQFNQVRALRPQRSASHRPTGIRAPFDPVGFQFNKPFLRKETFWSGALKGVAVDLLFNKFPFVQLHALLVPERAKNEPQYLDRASHLWAWTLAEDLAAALPGVGFGYNAYGACASVNHRHFQMFVRERLLPVDQGHWRHNGGPEPYPACCERYSDPHAAWERITDLHSREIAYNLLYLPGRLYCMPRRLQGSYELPQWCGGQAWYELAGGVVSFNVDDYESLGEDDVRGALAASAQGIRI